MANSTDPFSASVIPFEVPEQVRAFAEKGVSQARESYTKFKDAAETHNSTIEAVFTTATRGVSDYSTKLLDIFKANSSATFDFAQELVGVRRDAEERGERDTDVIELGVGVLLGRRRQLLERVVQVMMVLVVDRVE